MNKALFTLKRRIKEPGVLEIILELRGKNSRDYFFHMAECGVFSFLKPIAMHNSSQSFVIILIALHGAR